MVNIRQSVDYVNSPAVTGATPNPMQAAVDALDALSAEALRIRAQLEALAALRDGTDDLTAPAELAHQAQTGGAAW